MVCGFGLIFFPSKSSGGLVDGMFLFDFESLPLCARVELWRIKKKKEKRIEKTRRDEKSSLCCKRHADSALISDSILLERLKRI